jgi:hypothetical protein
MSRQLGVARGILLRFGMLQHLASLFSIDVPRSDYGRREYYWLAFFVVVGTVLRFWGLGNVGLAGDEEIMAFATLSVVETGLPHMPGGMLYPRALLEIYLMSASVLLFGPSEWAMRVPSALCGVLGIVAAFFLGKRFLTPRWNLAFVAVVALLPALVEASMIARMYIFLTTFLTFYAAAIFRWERTGRFADLALAFFIFLIALQFHVLAMLASVLFLWPGLVQASWRRLGIGAGAIAAATVAVMLLQDWMRSRYPDRGDVDTPVLSDRVDAILPFAAEHAALVVGALLVGLVIVALAARLGRGTGPSAWVAHALYAGAVTAAALLQYHPAALLFLAATIVRLRQVERWDARELGGIAAVAAFMVALAAAQFYLLFESGAYPGRRVLGALIGYVSIWPVLRFSPYSIGGVALYVAALGYAFYLLARRRRIPDHFLLFAMAVWAPLLLLGLMAQDVAPRYTFGMLPFFALCAVAASRYLVAELWPGGRRFGEFALAAVLLALIVNPLDIARAANPTYGRYPDHKGAAEFIASLDLAPTDILVAEDVLQQTYYLGKVDYWLMSMRGASIHLDERDGRVVDQYTATPLISRASELQAVLDGRGSRNVYVIGSGENFVGARRTLRDAPVEEILESGLLEVVYTGRDGKTKVWRAAPLGE